MILLLIVSSVIINSDAAKILAFIPTPSLSHQIVFRPLSEELARRGHEITVITADPAFPKGEAPENLKEIDVHDVSYEIWKKELSQVFIGKAMHAQHEMFNKLQSKLFEEQLKKEEVQHIIKNEHFDLLLIEIQNRPAISLSHVFKAPVILVSSFGLLSIWYKIIGAPPHPLLYPTILRQRLYNLTWWETAREIRYQCEFEHIKSSQDDEENVKLKRIFGADFPDLYELNNNIDVSFVNEHPIWNDNRPAPSKVIFLGGMHQRPAKELPKDLKSYLDFSKHGVIYISFGTNVQPSILPPEKIKMMIKVFSELPYDVIWKWDKDLPGKSDNIKVYNWLPQSDLLHHPNLKLFITQGGLQSTDEAITGGVPVIGIPFLADQWYNVEKYVHHGIGLQLEIGTFTEKQFKDAINTVINNESYRNNIIRLRSLITDQPQTPLQRAVWWVEYVLRHGGAKHLRAPAFNMSWAEYLELDLVLIALAISILVLVVLCFAVYYIQRFVMKGIFPSVKLKVS